MTTINQVINSANRLYGLVQAAKYVGSSSKNMIGRLINPIMILNNNLMVRTLQPREIVSYLDKAYTFPYNTLYNSLRTDLKNHPEEPTYRNIKGAVSIDDVNTGVQNFQAAVSNFDTATLPEYGLTFKKAPDPEPSSEPPPITDVESMYGKSLTEYPEDYLREQANHQFSTFTKNANSNDLAALMDNALMHKDREEVIVKTASTNHNVLRANMLLKRAARHLNIDEDYFVREVGKV